MNLFTADELPNVVQTTDWNMFSVEYFSLEKTEVNAYSQVFSFLRGINDGCVSKSIRFLVFILGFTIPVMPYLDSYYLFELHCKNKQGSMASQDKSLLLNVSGLQDIERYIEVEYLQERNHSHAYCQIQYVQTNVSHENTSHVLNTFQKSWGVARKQRH